MNELPKRDSGTMSDAIALSSPCGRMSKRARKKASDKLGRALFGDYDPHAKVDQTTEETCTHKLNYAKFLRDLTARGMGVRKYVKEAERIEAEVAVLRASANQT